ncbi:MAG: arsenic efflux protein [Deltaproteobacteria bacterium]|nr:arsenic efflux protein [Deltaproteobacteria bacterium]
MIVAIEVLKHALIITFFVFVMMVLIDYVNVMTGGWLSLIVRGGQWRQYFVASFLGATPGCLGAFLNVSFYVHGLLSFGAITAGMIATSGDEAFVMLAMFPDKALMLFGVLFVLAIGSGWLVDKVADMLKIKPCEACQLQQVHSEGAEGCRCFNREEIFPQLRSISLPRFVVLFILVLFTVAILTGILGPPAWNWQRIILITLLPIVIFIATTVPEHYLREHIWDHIVKKHLWRVFLWTFGALLVVDLGLKYWNLESFVQAHMVWVLVIATLVAVIPESGPHLIFVMMFADGLVPFSVILASSIVQDGHGMLPLLSYTVRDTVLIKLFNLVIGLGLGLILYSLGS